MLDEIAFSPHKYVEMAIDFKGARVEEWQAVTPKDFPLEKPIGPPNAPDIHVA